MKKTIYPIAVLAISILAACGGGGGDGGDGGSNTVAGTTPPATTPPAETTPPAATTPPASANTGSVSASFVRSSAARYMLLGIGSQSFGVLNDSVQDGTGAMTTLNANVLSGTTAVKEISGNANVAQGRWSMGTVTKSSGAETLTGTGNAAYHYVAYNTSAAYPTSGTASCDAGNFTAPNYIGGSASTTTLGATTGNAAITFGTAGATVSGALNTSAGGSSGVASLNVTVPTPTSLSFAGSTPVGVGADGTNGYLVLAGYTVTLSNGSKYQGIASFRCK